MKDVLRDSLKKRLYESDEMFDVKEEEQVVEINEDVEALLKKAFLEGFLASSDEFNGKEAKVIHKESQLKPDTHLWDTRLKESYNKFVRKIKRYGI